MVQDASRAAAEYMAKEAGLTPGEACCPDLDAVAKAGPGVQAMSREFDTRLRRNMMRAGENAERRLEQRHSPDGA